MPGPILTILLALATGPVAHDPVSEPDLAHRVSIRIAGPVALVEVERDVLIGGTPAGASDTVVDLDLPESAVLVDWGVRARGRTVKLAAAAQTTARAEYAAVLSSHHLVPASAPPDDAARVRVRLAPLAGPTRVLLHYRYTAPAACSDGRFVLRLPPSLEENPSVAHVTVRFDDLPADIRLAEASVAGVPVRISHNGRAALVHATAPLRAAWEVSYALHAQAAAWPGQLAAARASRRTSGAAADVLAIGLCRPQPSPVHHPQGNLMLLIDRSRSVGTGGMSSQRALARALLEALPPAQRFNAMLFARTATQVFALPRTATREALDALEAAADPNQLENGTDLVAALARVLPWAKGEGASQDGAFRLLVIISDGALPESQTAEKLAGALVPGVSGDKLRLLVLLVRPAADDRVPDDVVERLDRLAGRFGGVLRVLTAEDLPGVARSSLAALAQGGDLFTVRIQGREGREVAAGVAPGAGFVRVLSLPAGQGARIQVAGEYSGATVRASAPVARVGIEWLQPMADPQVPSAWAGSSSAVAVAVEAVVPHLKPATDSVVRGQMDPLVLRNALLLAYLPRARACYLSRRVANAVDLNLRGRLRLELHLERGELEEAVIRRSNLDRPEIEGCVREAAFSVEYPRPMFRDAPTVAALNLVFRPRTPEEVRPDASPFDRQIDLILGPIIFDPQKLLQDELRESGAAEKDRGD